MFASDADVLRATISAFKQADTVSDADFVTRAIGAFRSRGLGTIGLQRVRAALTLGQVDRLLVPAVASAAATEEASGDVGAAHPHLRQPSQGAVPQRAFLALLMK